MFARWTCEPAAGHGEYTARIPNPLVEAVHRLAAELQVPSSTIWLAAHAKVLAALSGEREVQFGYAGGEGRPPWRCRMTTQPRSWRELVSESRRAEAQLVPQNGVALETFFDPADDAGPQPGDNVVLSVGIKKRHANVLRLRYASAMFDAEYAARIAGYHLAAADFMTLDADAEHERQSLLAVKERSFQIKGLAGRRRRLPRLRAHEIFEEHALAHPNTIAAVCGDEELTYRDLNARANRLAHELLRRGLRREGIVAVVTERNLNWVAAVLAIFKAGGAYLPIEPHFPADRIGKMLSRAGCLLVLTESGSRSMLDRALALLTGVKSVDIDTVTGSNDDTGNPCIRVAPDQLAYIYFTSGSTGRPKGVMCEHAGMLNHLFAKIDDLGIRDGRVVAQTAPQCFDISLWQLLSALLVGGRTLIVPQHVILDASRFVDTLIDGKVNVVQVVPSYLDVMLSSLAQKPRELPDLRYVSATGEALKSELVQRWFALQPKIKLVNAYGLTETSDDTNHEIMDRAPDDGRVPLGRPVNNVHVYVVDEQLALVPLGAPGEIVFSGVCVGRGYINDPERTRRAYMEDPHRKGHRLYRSGDYGRWLPDGRLEFLGRRDAQVKISGFRIEIGDIENTLLRLPGIRDAAVVVVAAADRDRRLVAFYGGDHPLDGDVLRDRLRELLPEYMVPSAFHWRKSLALTNNGKIDRQALAAIAVELDGAGHDHDALMTPTEQWLASAWADVLGIATDRIGRHDHFFDMGGTSLSLLKLAVALNRAVSFSDLSVHPVLADQASLIDRTAGLNVPPPAAALRSDCRVPHGVAAGRG
jgi:amino acid adenylation domain-containing protein